MIAILKSWTLRLFGEHFYLRMLQILFHISYHSGFLRSNYIYKFHYLVPKIIQPNDTIVDIGANLGFYTNIFARLTASSGQVVAIEPIPTYMRALKTYASSEHIDYWNVALGLEEKEITMSTPKSFGYFRPGLSKVAASEADLVDAYTFSAKMMPASKILAKYPKIDYIKMDIEGYESIVIPEILEELKSKRPILQVEFGADGLNLLELLAEIGYVHYIFDGKKLLIGKELSLSFGDVLLVHTENKFSFESKMKDLDLI